MQKTLFFISPVQPHYIEVNNNEDTKKTFKVYFEGENLNLFKIEDYAISQFNSFDNSYSVTVGAKSSVYLEIIPKCGDTSVDAYVFCHIQRDDKEFIETYKLCLALRKEKYSRSVSKYSNLNRKFSKYEKNENDTFALLSSNPLLSGNTRLTIDSKSNMYFSLIDSLSKVNNSSLFNRKIKNGSDYVKELTNLFQEMEKPKESFYNYYTKLELNNSNTVRNLYNQVNDDIYMSGCGYYPSKFHNERFSIFAPLYLGSSIPSKFVIFKRKGYQNIRKENLFKDLEIVKTFDLTEKSELGKFLRRTINIDNFDKSHIETDIKNNTVMAKVFGVDPSSSSITGVYEDLTPFIENESRVIDFEKYVTETYLRRSMVSHRIVNMEFLFDDVSDNTSSYFGMYVDDLSIDEVNLNLSHYGQDFLIQGKVEYNNKSKEIYTNSNVPLDSKYINTNDRLFYFNYKDVYRNVLDSKILDNKLNLTLDREVDLNDLSCEDEVIEIKEEDVIDDVKPYTLIDFSQGLSDNSRLIIKGKDVDYVFQITSDEFFINNEDKFTEYQKQDVTETADVNSDGYIKINGYYKLPDDINVKLYDSSELLGEYPLAYSLNNGNDTHLYFSDAVDIEDVEYVEFVINKQYVFNVEYSSDIFDLLGRISELITSSSVLNYTSEPKENSLAICNTLNQKFTVYLDFTESSDNVSDVKFFERDAIQSQYTVGNSDYNSNWGTVESTEPVNPNYIYVKLDDYNSSIVSSDYYSFGDNREYKMEPIFKDSFSIKYTDNTTKITKVPKKSVNKKIVKPCKINFGLFSIYETKDFNVDKLANLYDYIDEEYRLIYRNYSPDEKLVPRMIYNVENTGHKELRIKLKMGVENSWNHIDVETIYVSPGEIKEFSTFASDYDYNYYNENIEFRYELEKGSGRLFKVYLKSIFTDPDLKEGDFEFPFSSLINKSLNNYIEESKENNEIFFPYLKNSRSEYMRLQEFSNENTQLRDIAIPQYVKWGSIYNDSKGEPYRLSVSHALGKTGYASTFSNYESDSRKRSHEWFIVEEPPTHINLYEGSEGMYLFSQISKSLLLDETYDYFTEYFENGYPNVLNNETNRYTRLNKKQNYSHMKRVGEGKYETIFKGGRFRLTSDTDLEDYKFAIAVSTRPETEVNQNYLIDHCKVEDDTPSCKKDGIFPKIMDAIDVLTQGNQSVNLSISFIQSGTTVQMGTDEYTTTGIDSAIYNSNDFFNDLDKASDVWSDEFNRIYNTSNKWPYNLTLSFNENNESGNFPVTKSHITSSQKQQYDIGDVRIGFAPLGTNDIAKTYYITESEYLESFERMTPVILLNSNVNFRKNTDTSSTDAYSLAYVIAHELGHIFGLGHNTKPDSIMEPSIKLSNNLDVLDQESTQQCIEFVYGVYTPFEPIVVKSDFKCSTVRKRKDDSFEFIVNQKYKNITLKIYVDIPNYLSLDSKKSYVDFYVSNTLKRLVKYNKGYYIEGLDYSLPKVDLSSSSISIVNEKYTCDFIDSDKINLDENSVGYNAPMSAYRIRIPDEKKENYQFANFSFDYSDIDNSYNMNRSLDYEGSFNKPLLFRVSNASDSSENVDMPLLSKNKYKDSFFYRIMGGDSIENGSYKLTLDYLENFSPNIDYYYSDDTTGRLFDFTVMPIDKFKVSNLKRPVRNENDTFRLDNTGNSDILFRYSTEYNPLFDQITYFGIRDEYEISNLLGVDFYKLNTRILWEHPNFGVYNRVAMKNSLEPITDDRDDVSVSLYRDKIPFYNQRRFIYDSPFDDDIYKLYLNPKDSVDLSGFYDPILFKNNLNSVLYDVPLEFNINISDNFIEFIDSNDNIEIKVNKRDILVDYLYQYLESVYSDIYNIEDVEIKDSLEKFIVNNLISLYKIDKIKLYTKENSVNQYQSSKTGLAESNVFKVDKNENNITITKDIVRNLTVSLELKYKYI